MDVPFFCSFTSQWVFEVFLVWGGELSHKLLGTRGPGELGVLTEPHQEQTVPQSQPSRSRALTGAHGLQLLNLSALVLLVFLILPFWQNEGFCHSKETQLCLIVVLICFAS